MTKDYCVEKCPVEQVVNIIGGKYKIMILYHLSQQSVLRFNQLLRILSPISHRTLARQLKELEMSGLVLRKEFDEVPPKVEYRLSPTGESLYTILEQLEHWGLS
ncbi:helix-turn-helix domain-containing protein [Exiguobacterium sp. s191]|uniref:winged helix-turn-helix transcriptional regulator n=1 Tax=Exiguobacterium sp. s191 TaxID=2751196 RepID=UPI002036B25D|nr:helix-turn-helix domain-containing protein [Exiguobacterium sp. s191]